MREVPVDPASALLDAVRAIPPGEVRGYGELAAAAGLPGRARWLARLLAACIDPDLPWHRVLRADGRIAFPVGSPGFDEQVRRLRAEGVTVEGGRVRRAAMAHRPTLDALLWAPSPAARRYHRKSSS